MTETTGFIPHSRPLLGEAEQQAVARVVASGHIAQGPEVAAFEREFAETFGFAEAVAASSGTAALHLALAALEIGPGDEVVLPAYVCTALLNAVAYVGARPVLVDVDPATGNTTAELVAGKMTAATRAVIVPHMFGVPVDVSPLLGRGAAIIEDCAQAVGATLGGRPVGAAGDLAVFSFYATKVMATGEGGMVVCRSADMAGRLRDLRSYDERPRYRPRFNYKMTDLQAALGRCQLQRLPAMLAARRRAAAAYRDALQGIGLQLPPEVPGRIHFRFALGVPGDLEGWIAQMAAQQVGCARPVFRPLNACLGLGPAGFAGTEHAFAHLMSVPLYPALSMPEIERVIRALQRTAAGRL